MVLTFAILAHGSGPEDLSELVRAWEFDPLVVALLVASAGLYLRGLLRLWRALGARGLAGWEVGCFALGWLSIVLALVSPLHRWGSVLFAAHMTQHEILMLISAPLLVLGRPLAVFLSAFPVRWAHALAHAALASPWRPLWRFLTRPFIAFMLHAGALWLWHVPVLFQATLSSDLIHSLQHGSFLGSALLFWWAIVHGRHALGGYGLAILYMFATALHSGLLGALIVFATRLYYPAYGQGPQAWSLTPLEDQQLGGLIMWIPAGLVYVVAGLLFFVGWVRESERRTQRWQTRVCDILPEGTP